MNASRKVSFLEGWLIQVKEEPSLPTLIDHHRKITSTELTGIARTKHVALVIAEQGGSVGKVVATMTPVGCINDCNNWGRSRTGLRAYVLFTVFNTSVFETMIGAPLNSHMVRGMEQVCQKSIVGGVEKATQIGHAVPDRDNGRADGRYTSLGDNGAGSVSQGRRVRQAFLLLLAQ